MHYVTMFSSCDQLQKDLFVALDDVAGHMAQMSVVTAQLSKAAKEVEEGYAAFFDTQCVF